MFSVLAQVMQSTESPSSQLSQDSLSSNNSFVFSDDFFLLEDRDRPHGAHSTHSSVSNRSVCSMNEEEERPGSQWMCDEFSDHEKSPDNSLSRSASLSISSFLSFSSSSSSGLGCSSSKSKQRKNGVTEGDLIFAHKCLELQGFVQPLLELLNGLKKGRFDKGLSSFQQSVAMDRIQRIVGLLQKPHIGERYLPTLLKIEVMLKLWFPQVTNQVSVTPNPADLSPHNFFTHGINNTSPHRQKDQLHIPVKKRRLSWSDTDSCSSSPPVMCKHSKVKLFNEHHPWPHVDGGEGSSRISHANQPDEQNGETPLHKVIQWSSSKLTWVHIAPIFSPPKSGLSHMGGIVKNGGIGSVLLPISPLISRSSPAMQDSYVSSTTSFSALTGCQCQSVHLGKTCPLQECVHMPATTVKSFNLVQKSLHKPA